jgi:type IV secretion system protein VirB8
MNDVAHDFSALPILNPERDQYYPAVRSFQGHQVLHYRRRLRTWFCVAMVTTLIAAASTFALATVLPLKTTVPLFLLVREDGTVDTGVSLADLGLDQTEKVIRASVWRYIEERESYSYSEAKHRYDLVSLMSAPNVQHDYQQWFLRADDSPQKTLGQKGQLTVQEISMSPVRDGVFLVRFHKITQIYGTKPIKTTATATVEYQLLHDAPAAFILDDPAALQVTRYQVEDNSP